jgi:hypothetical protein
MASKKQPTPSTPTTSLPPAPDNKVIVIATNGFVFMGFMVPSTTERPGAPRNKLIEASCIRRWGTEHGLGQIALTGPTKDTVLDPCGEIEFPEGATIAIIRCRV